MKKARAGSNPVPFMPRGQLSRTKAPENCSFLVPKQWNKSRKADKIEDKEASQESEKTNFLFPPIYRGLSFLFFFKKKKKHPVAICRVSSVEDNLLVSHLVARHTQFQYLNMFCIRLFLLLHSMELVLAGRNRYLRYRKESLPRSGRVGPLIEGKKHTIVSVRKSLPRLRCLAIMEAISRSQR